MSLVVYFNWKYVGNGILGNVIKGIYCKFIIFFGRIYLMDNICFIIIIIYNFIIIVDMIFI